MLSGLNRNLSIYSKSEQDPAGLDLTPQLVNKSVKSDRLIIEILIKCGSQFREQSFISNLKEQNTKRERERMKERKKRKKKEKKKERNKERKKERKKEKKRKVREKERKKERKKIDL